MSSRRNSSAAMPLPVTAVDHRFNKVQLLARGGMGEIYYAFDRRLGHPVALKSIRPEYARHRKHQKRLEREAMVMQQVDHPNLVTLYEYVDDGHQAFFIMEYVPGLTLEAVTSKKPMAPAKALAVIDQVAGALAELHSHSILHRDVTPSNIILRSDGMSKLMDFGLVKLSCQNDLTDLTDEHGLVGTLLYMPPEYLSEKAWTERSDVYQLGAVLYKLLTGEPPFSATTVLNWRNGVIGQSFCPPSMRLGRAFTTVDDIVGTALAVNPRKRCSSALGLQQACRNWLSTLEGRRLHTVPSSKKRRHEQAKCCLGARISPRHGNPSPPLRRKTQSKREHIARKTAVRPSSPSSAKAMGLLFLLVCSMLLCSLSTPHTHSPPPSMTAKEKRANLHRMVATGNVKAVEALAISGADLHELDRTGQTPLHRAVIAKEADIIRLLVDNGVHIEVTNTRGFTALQLAAAAGWPSLVATLLSEGANPNNGGGVTPALHLALTPQALRGKLVDLPLEASCRSAQREIALMLLNAGAHGLVRSPRGETALHLAAAAGLHDVVVAILQRGVTNIDCQDQYGETALHHALRSTNPRGLVRTLIGAGASPRPLNKDGHSVLEMAVEKNLPTVAALIRQASQS